jgi:uncharacterized protein YciI
MQFVALCTDKPNGLEIRMQHRPEHLAWLEANKARVLLAGPFLDGAGQMTGSMLVIEADDEADAKAFLAGDPFARVGLFSASEVKPWRRTFGAAL